MFRWLMRRLFKRAVYPYKGRVYVHRQVDVETAGRANARFAELAESSRREGGSMFDTLTAALNGDALCRLMMILLKPVGLTPPGKSYDIPAFWNGFKSEWAWEVALDFLAWNKKSGTAIMSCFGIRMGAKTPE